MKEKILSIIILLILIICSLIYPVLGVSIPANNMPLGLATFTKLSNRIKYLSLSIFSRKDMESKPRSKNVYLICTMI